MINKACAFGERYWGPIAIPIGLVLFSAGRILEHAAVFLALALVLAAVWSSRWRSALTAGAASLLLAAGVSLSMHLLGDDFDYWYVWLYSATALPWHLKLANLWGGDEGTLLLLATLMAFSATRLCRYRGWAGPGALLLTAGFTAGAMIWDPFATTPLDRLAQAQSRGMNAHLMSIWMVFHPPLVFIAYTYILAPAGAALEALALGRGDWAEIARRYSRSGWLILSSGLAAGMWWAYEDYTFGQFWHWDPVQTSVFVVWALVTAYLHGLSRYNTGTFFPRFLPSLALAAAVTVLGSMIVTRNELLASSHRYIGDTSFPVLAAMAAVLALAAVSAWVWALRHAKAGRAEPQRDSLFTIKAAVILFSLVAAVAAFHLVDAYVQALMEQPRPEELKPFLQTLIRWTSSDEYAALRRIFDQWDPDRFAINRWLAPVSLLLCLFGGHHFLPARSRIFKWVVTGVVIVVAVIAALKLRPLDSLFTGTGMTSRYTVEIFHWLNALFVAVGYLLASILLWEVSMVWRTAGRARVTYYLPVGLIHIGVMLALIGAVSATVLDTYTQRTVTYPQDFGKRQSFANGYSVIVDMDHEDLVTDGGRSLPNGQAFKAVATVSLSLTEGNSTKEIDQGQTLYRDERPPVGVEGGPVRDLCQILDYRYARYVSGPAHRLDPFIHRGLWQDLQVWVPAINYRLIELPQDGDGEAVQREAATIPLVIKSYPLLSWVWIGLTISLIGAGLLTVLSWTSRA
ncbi:MAG: cytochrome c biogenesis protein CcsA [Gammaproteobacteria bacterium]|nr:cytochrome c biogenesis protein CcsA [Gammaproteobacteria bacterium]